MLKRRLWIVLVMFVVAACSGSALYREDFRDADGLPDTLSVEGLYAGTLVDEPVLRLIVDQQVRGESGYVRLPVNSALSDYSVEVRVRVSAGEMRLWGRTADARRNGYVLILAPTLDTFRLSKVVRPGTLQTMDLQSRLDLEFNEWYTLRLEMNGDTIRGYLNDVEYFEETDTEFASGTAFIEVFTDSLNTAQVELDEIIVR